MGTLLSFIGFIKYLGGTVPAYWVFPETGQPRLTSTFVTPNYHAGYLEMVFVLGLGFILCRPSKTKIIWVSCLFLILMSILLSMSRGALLATVSALIFMGILFFQAKGVSKTKVLLVGSALLLTITLTFLGSGYMIKRLEFLKNPEDSYFTRLAVWKGSIQLINKNPVFGTGLGTFPWSFPAVRPAGLEWRYREAINDYIQLATETGIIGLLPIMWGIYLVFKAGIQTFRQTNSRFRAGVTLGALCGVTAMLIHSIVDYNIQITSNGILFSVLVGLVMGQGRKDYSYLSEGS
jgi:O-antigen ligase